MKRALSVFAMFVALAFGLLVANALRSSPRPRSASEPKLEGVDAQQIAAHLAQAIRFRTVSHQDPTLDDRSTFAALRAFLETTYPRVHAALSRELVNGDGLLYRWQGSDPSARPLLFLAHQDVVPVEPGTESRWTHPPFEGVIANGFVWGRGAIDDKASLIGLFEAFESLLAAGWKPARSVFLASGFDEEVGGREGAAAIARLLAERGVRFEWVVDEGAGVSQGILPDVERPVATIAVSEKGYLSLELVAHGEGGHSSMPPRDHAIGRLARAIGRLQRYPFPARLTPVLRESLLTLAPETPFLHRVELANLWLSAPLVVREYGARKETSPLVRTTTAPTILEAGVKENVVPTAARAIVNFRLLPGDTIASVTARVTAVIADRNVEIKQLSRTRSEAAKPASTSSAGYRLFEAAVERFFPDAVVVPGIVTGATDSRHYQRVASDVYRFVPRMLAKSDLKRIHGLDERASIDGLARMVAAYRFILERGACR